MIFFINFPISWREWLNHRVSNWLGAFLAPDLTSQHINFVSGHPPLMALRLSPKALPQVALVQLRLLGPATDPDDVTLVDDVAMDQVLQKFVQGVVLVGHHQDRRLLRSILISILKRGQMPNKPKLPLLNMFQSPINLPYQQVETV